MAEFLRGLKAKSIKVNYDPANMVMNGFDPVQGVYDLRDFISHTHADHVTGLPGILMLSSQVDRNEPLYVVGPPKITDYVQANRRILEMYINYKIEVVEESGEREVIRGQGYRVKTFPVSHSKPCLAYCLEEDMRPGVFYPEKAVSCSPTCSSVGWL